MGTLVALIFATPLFAVTLDVDTELTVPSMAWSDLSSEIAAEPGASSEEAEGTDFSTRSDLSKSEFEKGFAKGGDDDDDDDDASEGPTRKKKKKKKKNLATQLAERGSTGKIHKWIGIASWASMGITLLLGAFQYRNLYGGIGTGFDSQQSLAETPCVRGTAIFGQGQCSGVPWLHLGSAAITTALYSVAFGLSMRMKGPKNIYEGNSDYAKKLRRHKRLRWVHFAGMIAQTFLGIVIANSERFGLSRANNFGALKALSSVHLALGFMTFGAMTWAGYLFAF